MPSLAIEKPLVANDSSQVARRTALLATRLVPGGILKYLGQSARERRRQSGVKLVRIGAALDKSEGSLSRFESGQVWAELDAVVDAYAQELGVDPADLWAEALERWRDA